MNKFLDLQNPFYRPLWIRAGIVALCLFWAVLELVSGNWGWAALFCAAGAWSAWVFLITYQPPPDDKGET